MYCRIETWLNDVLEHKVPSKIPSVIRAFCFNLYEGGNGDWSMELVGTESFDPEDEDWACDEITDFGTREEPLSWKKETCWNEVLQEVSSALRHYLENGLHADVLKSCMGVAVGFTDGNLEILYSDLSGKAQAGMMDKTAVKENIQQSIATQNVEANKEALVGTAAVSRRKLSEPAKKATDIRTVMMSLAALVFVVGLVACLYFLYLHNRDTAADRQDLGGATQENNVGQADGEKEELHVPATVMPDAASDGQDLGGAAQENNIGQAGEEKEEMHDGMDTGLEMDTEPLQESAKAFLADFDIHPLYAAFLRNEISVKNPFVPEDSDYSELSFFDDRDYEDEHLVFRKSFSLVDVNGDGNAELVFRMIDSPSELMYILGVCDNELICFDILLTHTTHMAFGVYDNGIVYWGQNYDGDETIYYTFNDKGKEHELIHFVREENSDSDLYYHYYYLEGNEESQINLQSNEEYENLVSSYDGEEPEWFDCDSFADIPQNQLITETEFVEKNAKNTNELRISTSITKLWLHEDEEGIVKINAALREIYEAAEAEMETDNQEILDEYLFEDGVLQEGLDEWLLYPLDEWLAISNENYEASIEYADENYLCLSMNGDNFVAGGAHGYYWSDYYVFDRHTGQRLSLEDFVNDSTEDIKEIVKARILAVAPYSKGEQSEDALEQDRFFLTAEGLGIHYDVYEIGDYASGSFDLIIPFKLFHMKEDMWPGSTFTFYEKGVK